MKGISVICRGVLLEVVVGGGRSPASNDAITTAVVIRPAGAGAGAKTSLMVVLLR